MGGISLSLSLARLQKRLQFFVVRTKNGATTLAAAARPNDVSQATFCQTLINKMEHFLPLFSFFLGLFNQQYNFLATKREKISV